LAFRGGRRTVIGNHVATPRATGKREREFAGMALVDSRMKDLGEVKTEGEERGEDQRFRIIGS